MNDRQIIESLLRLNQVNRVVHLGESAWQDVLAAIRPDTACCLPPAGGAAPELCVVGALPAASNHRELLDQVRRACDAVLLTEPMCAQLGVHNGFTDDWVPVEVTTARPATLFLRKRGRFDAFKLGCSYGGGMIRLNRVIRPADNTPPTVVTIMDYPDDEKYNRMCMIWMKRVRLHAPDARVVILTARGLPPVLRSFFARYDNVSVQPAKRRNLGEYDHFNLAVKLYNLACFETPFIFLDADMFVLSDLSYLWARRHYKPWIGVDDQTTLLGISAPFPHLNSGLQVVADPGFYDYDLIIQCFNAHGRHFICNGEDQALLFDYFRSIGYDYRHPEINPGWNSCSRYTALARDEQGRWRGTTRNLPESYPVHIVHYWNGACRPWHIGCPLYAEESRALQVEAIESSVTPPPRRQDKLLRVHVLNAAPECLRQAGLHPFYPLPAWQVVWASAPDEADFIYWHLDPQNSKRDYDTLIYKYSALFKSAENRFVMSTPHLRPGFLYLHGALSFTPYPQYDCKTNRLSNVIAVPYLLDGADLALAGDEAFVQTCRAMTKTDDLSFAQAVEPLARSGVKPSSGLSLRSLPLRRSALAVLEAGRRDAQFRAALKHIAQSRFYLHVHGYEDVPLLLYWALRLGTVPIVVNLPDPPFAEECAWEEFALFPVPGQSLDALLTSAGRDYAARRCKAIWFADNYCGLEACNMKLVELYLAPRRAPERNG